LSVDEPAPRKMRIKSALAILLAAIISAVGTVWLWNAYWRTMASIMPGVGDTPSTSMEPYDLALFTRYKGSKPIAKDAPPLEWRLRMPRAFLRSEIGNADAVHMSSTDCCDHFIHLETVLDPDGKTLSPAIVAPYELRRKRVIGMSLANIGTPAEIASGNNCVTGDEFKGFMEKRGSTIDWRRACDPSNQRCEVFTHLDGWRVVLTPARELYSEPQRICDVARSFLDEHTINRDGSRQEPEQGE
jgi:hypothetical protein